MLYKIQLRSAALLSVIIIFTFFLQSCQTLSPTEQVKKTPVQEEVTLDRIIPKPVLSVPASGVFNLIPGTAIYTNTDDAELSSISRYLSEHLSPAAGFIIRVNPIKTALPSKGNIYIYIKQDASLGEEGYVLKISPDSLLLSANKAAGIFRGIQSIRQLLPSDIESGTVKPGPWPIACGTIKDYPRFQWRGVMLDVSRHFFSVQDVKRYIDLIALYKMNRFHMHLSDDQGWRLEIKSRPNLVLIGGSTQVGGGKGGYYTQNEFRDIIAYAASQYITIVPEFDMPGHTNAALASYPEINKNGISPNLYTGIDVGFSSYAVYKDETYKFIDDVVREVSLLLPGSYFHIGGDEVKTLTEKDYAYFINKVSSIVKPYKMQMIGWEDIAVADLSSDDIAQHWASPKLTQKAVSKGMKLIMSPSTKAYIDMKYNKQCQLGLNWAAYIEAQDAYSWDPATQLPGVGEGNILGVEAALWAETLLKIADIEYMAFPRVPGYAEIGWSPKDGRSWDEYKVRIGLQGPRLRNMKVNFYESPQIPWK